MVYGIYSIKHLSKRLLARSSDCVDKVSTLKEPHMIAHLIDRNVIRKSWKSLPQNSSPEGRKHGYTK